MAPFQHSDHFHRPTPALLDIPVVRLGDVVPLGGCWIDEWNNDPSKICTNVFYLLVTHRGSAVEHLGGPDCGGS